MLFCPRSDLNTPDSRTSDLLERIRRIEAEQTALRAQIEGDRQLRFLTAEIVGAAQAAPVIGSALEHFAQSMRAPLPRGRAGGLALKRLGAISTALSCPNRKSSKPIEKIMSATPLAVAHAHPSPVARRMGRFSQTTNEANSTGDLALFSTRPSNRRIGRSYEHLGPEIARLRCLK